MERIESLAFRHSAAMDKMNTLRYKASTNSVVQNWRDRAERTKHLASIPPGLMKRVTLETLRIFNRDGLGKAGEYLRETSDTFREQTLWRTTSSEDKLRAFAAQCARSVRKKTQDTADISLAVTIANQQTITLGIEPPKSKSTDDYAPNLKRMTCDLWWRRAIRKTQGRKIEQLAIGLGAVQRKLAIHASDHTVQRRKEQRARNADTLRRTIIENQTGERLSLADVAEKTISNPRIRRMELMTRIAGFDSLAKERGDVALFITWTCPASFHPISFASGEKNEQYNGQTPREAQSHLCKMWARTRAACARAKILFYGFRVAEPHHDACPHWHMVLWVAPAQKDALSKLLRKYALLVDGDEPGAREARCRIVEIDQARGSATGYIAKYISKNIDAYGLSKQLERADKAGQTDLFISPVTKAQRVDAWAACWGIRQFQQIGGPPVGVWRELRRLRTPVQDAEIERARNAADSASWSKFCKLIGNLITETTTATVELARVWCDKLGRYGQEIGWRVFGIQCGNTTTPTRLNTWRRISILT